MKSKKKNAKLVIGILLGILLSSGVGAYATSVVYKYVSTDVKYTKNETEMSVKDALDELYSKEANIVLAGHGEATYTSDTSLTSIPSQLDDSSILQISNNVFTTKKAGKYLLTYACGSNNADNTNNYYSAVVSAYVNDNSVGSLYISGGQFLVDYRIVNLNQGDEISFYYKTTQNCNGKKSLFKIYYIN